MCINNEVIISSHAIMRYAQRVNYLLSTYEIEQKIKESLNRTLHQKIGKHQQIINRVRYVISEDGYVVTTTLLPKENNILGENNGNNNSRNNRNKTSIQNRKKRYTSDNKRK